MPDIILSVISVLNMFEFFCLDLSIAIVSTKLNGFNYCDLTLVFFANIDHLFAHKKWLQILLFSTNYSRHHYSFLCTLLNSSKYFHVSLTIQLSISQFFAPNEMIKQFYFLQFNLYVI